MGTHDRQTRPLHQEDGKRAGKPLGRKIPCCQGFAANYDSSPLAALALKTFAR
jgi:hypothetical protein